MNERIFNIFVYFDDGLARSYGVRHHRVAGSDVEKATLLRAVAQSDCELAKRFALPRTFTPEQWRSAQRQGGVLCYFEQAFEIYRAPREPLFCLTAVVDGVVKVDLSISGANFRGDEVSAQQGRGAVPDYLVHYMDGVQFRLPELIHDDYFKAIKALFNCGLYVSCAKLLMSCIDTLAFVEFGDMPGNFSKWLDAYVDLAALNISSEELWEFRNSVVHMTNLASRKVVAGKVSPIVPYIGGPMVLPTNGDGVSKPFNLHGLLISVGDGIGRWAGSYNQDRDKLLSFIERYDLTISDVRMAKFALPPEVSNI